MSGLLTTTSICLGLPVYGMFEPLMVASLVDLNWIQRIIFKIDMPIAQAREGITNEWLSAGKDAEPYLLMIDSDMVFCSTDIRQLFDTMEDNPDIGMMTPLTVDRGGKYKPMANWYGDNGNTYMHGEQLEKMMKYHVAMGEVADVSYIGAGICILRKEAIESIDTPRWEMSYGKMHAAGEDILMGMKMRAKGWRTCVHFGVKVGHVGSKAYYPDGLDKLKMDLSQGEVDAIQQWIAKSRELHKGTDRRLLDSAEAPVH